MAEPNGQTLAERLRRAAATAAAVRLAAREISQQVAEERALAQTPVPQPAAAVEPTQRP